MNIHLPAILMWTTGVQGFDPLPNEWTKDLANQDTTRIWSVKDGPAKNGDLEGDKTNK